MIFCITVQFSVLQVGKPGVRIRKPGSHGLQRLFRLSSSSPALFSRPLSILPTPSPLSPCSFLPLPLWNIPQNIPPDKIPLGGIPDLRVRDGWIQMTFWCGSELSQMCHPSCRTLHTSMSSPATPSSPPLPTPSRILPTLRNSCRSTASAVCQRYGTSTRRSRTK